MRDQNEQFCREEEKDKVASGDVEDFVGEEREFLTPINIAPRCITFRTITAS